MSLHSNDPAVGLNVLPDAPGETELYEVKRRIATAMWDLYAELLKPIYQLYPDLEPRGPPS